MIQTNNLHFAYKSNQQWVLDGLNITISQGGIWALFGKNGVGKSTLLQLFAGILPPNSPPPLSVGINGHMPFLRGVDFLQDMFILPEEFSLPSIAITELAGCYGKFYPKFSHPQLVEILNEFEVDLTQKLNKMSLGQRKKAYIAFALATNTKVLLMDEPTNGLDIPSKMTFRRLMSKYADQQRTIIISSHQVRDLEEILDGVVILDNRRVLLCERIEAITSHLHFGVVEGEGMQNAIYTQSSLHGTIGVCPRTDGMAESKLDLELLFNAATCDPTAIQNLFTTKQ